MSKIWRSPSFWLGLSLTGAIIFAVRGLQLAFQNTYTVQDDARQHVFWMQRYLNRELFPDDLIADYFQSVAPWGYAKLYHFWALIKIDPFVVNKILPTILGIVATIYCFQVCLQIFPVPPAAFISTLLLNQNLWLVNDLSSGTPRAFFYPLFLAFLYYLLRRSLVPCLIAIALQGLFYPQAVLISIAILVLQPFFSPRFKLKNFLFLTFCLATGILTLAFYALKDSQFGAVITPSEARNLAEFLPGGRSAFFLDNPLKFWLTAPRSGILPFEWQYFLLFSFGCLLPFLKKSPSRFPLVNKLKPQAIILLQIVLASLAMFFLAHLFLFKLHLPSRYTQHSFRVALALADGIVVYLVIDAVSRLALQNLLRPIIGVFFVTLLILPGYYVDKTYPHRLGYLVGEAPKLYQFFQQQPTDILIASLSEQADFLPSFAERSVLVSPEYSIPYHTSYYQELRQRTIDLINAQYSQFSAEVKDFIAKYDIDFWIIEKSAFSLDYVRNNPWIMQYDAAAAIALTNITKGTTTLAEVTDQCTLLEDENYFVLEAECILEQSN